VASVATAAASCTPHQMRPQRKRLRIHTRARAGTPAPWALLVAPVLALSTKQLK
jgi:hypothetical protein